MTDDADAIALKIRRAKTDPEPLPDTIEALEERPEADNLVGIYAALTDRSREQVLGGIRRPELLRLQAPGWPRSPSRSLAASAARCAG